MHNTSNILESFISPSSHKISHMKEGADMFKLLQHIKAKSYKLRTKLVDFSGAAQKEHLIYLARGDMSMSELMANPAHSTIVGIWYFGMGKPCQSLLIDVCKNTCIWYFGMGQPCQILLIDVSKKTCVWYFGMGRPLPSANSTAFSIFLSCEINIGCDLWMIEMDNHLFF